MRRKKNSTKPEALGQPIRRFSDPDLFDTPRDRVEQNSESDGEKLIFPKNQD